MPESSLWLITTRQQRTKGSNYPIQQAAILPRRQQLQFKGRYKQSFSPPFHGQLKLLNTKETSPANPGHVICFLFFTPSHFITMTAKDLQQQPFQVFNQCVFNRKDNRSLVSLLTKPKTEEKTCHNRLGLGLTD